MVLIRTRTDKKEPRTIELSNTDWMAELEQDAGNIHAILTSLDTQAKMATENLKQRNVTDAIIRLEQIREGLRLVAELMGLKLA